MSVHVVPSGEQFELVFGEQRATVVEVGGGIRAYDWGERPVLHPYPVNAMCDGAHGAPLVPWPNRLADGRYRFAGTEHQVALTEPDKHNAIHGFLLWRSWQAVEQAADRVVMGIRLHPLNGYPFMLDVRVEYALDADGLTVRTTATNVGERACPYGVGHHPYLSPGAGVIDDCVLELGAATRIRTDEHRQLPTGTEPVEGTPFDFRAGHRLGDLSVDFAFTDLTRDADGRAWTRLTGPDGRTAELWVDHTYPLVEIFTADGLAGGRHRAGLAAEPMTCPPNALATGDRVITLEPGESVTATWGARLR
ncbi:MAG TPA: aldose 1-epimerase family protein [Pseudonocardiaceae bacterium]|jgi:aldose 1-epimerase